MRPLRHGERYTLPAGEGVTVIANRREDGKWLLLEEDSPWQGEVEPDGSISERPMHRGEYADYVLATGYTVEDLIPATR